VRSREWDTKHNRRVTKLRLLLLLLLLLSKTVLLFLICDKKRRQVMIHRVAEYIELGKVDPIVNSRYNIIREVASYQLAQHPSLHSRDVVALGCPE
jgi:hypothetical protein